MNLFALQTALNQTLPMARLDVTRLPDCEAIELALINADFPTGPLPPDVMREVIANPAYWAFCWGSGLGLARFLFEHPDWVRGKTVIDLGSGSGVVAIAAAKVGASKVIACDLDPHARLATTVNAHLNGTPTTVVDRLDGWRADIVLMADVLYDQSNWPLLDVARSHADTVLVADSRVTQLPEAQFHELTTLNALTFPNLGEFDEFSTVHIFRNRTR